MEEKQKIGSLANIPDVDVKTLDEAKMLISALKQSHGEVKDALTKTLMELNEVKQQSNANFKKLLSITKPVEEVEPVEQTPNFENIKI